MIPSNTIKAPNREYHVTSFHLIPEDPSGDMVESIALLHGAKPVRPLTKLVAGAGLVRDNSVAVATEFPRPWLAVSSTNETSLRLANPYSEARRCFGIPATHDKSPLDADFVFRVAGAGFAPATSRL